MLETNLFHLAFRLILRRFILTATTFFGIMGVVSPQMVHSGPILEDFEEQSVGQFPVGWTDVGVVDLSLPNPPDPSAVVINTTDAFGSTTNALQILDAAARSPGFTQGIFRSLDAGSFYQMKMHTRIDQFNNNPDRRFPGTDVPITGGFVLTGPNSGKDLAYLPGIQVYVSTLRQDWRLFVRTPNTESKINNRWIPLDVPAELDKWYEVELEIFADTGRIHTRITDLAASSTLVDRIDDFSTVWDPSIDGSFDAAAFFDAELFTNNPTGNIAVVDNIFVESVNGLLGDLNGDGLCDVSDIDLLTDQVTSEANLPDFDMNHDGLVNDEDRRVWVEDLKRTYFGDADLDGEFNTTDLIAVFQAGEYEDGLTGNSMWSDGDWNGDGDFDTGDLVAAFQDGGYEIGPRIAVSAVPEPSGVLLFAYGIGFSVVPRIHRKRLDFRVPPTDFGTSVKMPRSHPGEEFNLPRSH